MKGKYAVGVIGCGSISKIYFETLRRFSHVEVVACADINSQASRARAEEFSIPKCCSPEELLADGQIDAVVNLTIPQAHVGVDIATLEAGKHVFSEKPLALNLEEARRVSRLAAERNLRLGCAPDTVLGAGIQTCRKLVDDGAIGKPLVFVANMLCGGHETWHPNPEFYYQPGGGPLFDMGPYYLHALINLLGPVKSLVASATACYAERIITSQPKYGSRIKVEVPTHLIAILEFHSGVVGTLTVSFDVKSPHNNPRIEIYGETGSLSVPDPNGFGGRVLLGPAGQDQWNEIALSHPYFEESRGLGLIDLLDALKTGRPHRANDIIALHAVEIMQAIHESAHEGRRITLTTSCERPLPMSSEPREW